MEKERAEIYLTLENKEDIYTMIDDIKELRQLTQLPISVCHKALKDCKGDLESALKLLRSQGNEISQNLLNKNTKIQRLYTYLHYNYKYASLCQFSCETDFVANSKEFLQFMEDICIHVAATELPCHFDSLFFNYDPEGGISSQSMFLKQPFVKDNSKTIVDLLKNIMSITGEKISIDFISRKTVPFPLQMNLL